MPGFEHGLAEGGRLDVVRRWEHVFGVDGFRCPRCGERMVVRPVIIHPAATLRVLRGLEQAAARAPPDAGDRAA